MKKIFKMLSLFFIVLLIFSIIAGCGKHETQQTKVSDDTVILKAAIFSTPNAQNAIAIKFKEIVEAKTNGKVKVEFLPGIAVARFGGSAKGLKNGFVQVAIDSIYSLEPYCSLAAIDAFPFLYRDEDHFIKVWQGEIGKRLLDEIGNNSDVEIMGPMLQGARYITSKKMIENADDVIGLKIRVPQIKIYIKTWEKLGAIPMPTIFECIELFKRMNDGVIEAQENSVPFSYRSGFYQVCPYLIKTRHVYNCEVFIFDKAYFAGLPDDLKKALREAAEETAQWRTEYELSQEKEYLLKFKEKDVKVIEPDLKTFTDKLEGLLQDFPDLQGYVEEIRAVK